MKGSSSKRKASKSPVPAAAMPTPPKRVRSRKVPSTPPAPIIEPGLSTPAAESRRQKRVRDRFSMPREDYKLIDALKERSAGLERPAKKSELLRAGLHALNQASCEELLALLDALTPTRKKRDRSADDA